MPEAIGLGLFGVFLTSGWLAQQAVDKWTRTTGRAPMISKGRGSWAAYMRVTEQDMPVPLRKRLALLRRVGNVTLFSMFVVAAVQGIRHHH